MKLPITELKDFYLRGNLSREEYWKEASKLACSYGITISSLKVLSLNQQASHQILLF